MHTEIINYGLIIILSIISIYVLKKHRTIKKIFLLRGYRKEDIGNVRLAKILLITFLFFIPLLLVFYQKFIVALIIFMVNICLSKITIDILSDVEAELTVEISDFINSLIKEFSIQDNLINIIENTLNENDSIFVKEMIQPIFKRLVETQDKDIFNKSLQKFDNLWMSSLLMLLDEYSKNSDRDLMISSLNNLYDIININISISQETKSKMNVMLISNNFILFVGLIGGIVDFIINSYSRLFFISTIKGNCFLFGADILIFGTLIVLAKMIKGFKG